MKKILTLTLILAILLFSTSCSLLLELSKINNDGNQSIQSGESGLVMVFPKSWSKYELHDEATIQMCNMLKDQYFIVLEEDSIDFASDYTLEHYVSTIFENMRVGIDTSDKADFKDVVVGKNIKAKQFELAAIVEKIKVKYLVTCTEVDGIYYQFTAWSTQSKYDDAKPVFEEILDSASFPVGSSSKSEREDESSSDDSHMSIETSLDALLPVGESITKKDSSAACMLSIAGVIRGPEADSLVASAGRSDYIQPGDTQEYMIVKMNFDVTELESNEIFEPYLSPRLIYDNGLVIDEVWDYSADFNVSRILDIPMISRLKLAKTGNITAYAVFLVQKAQTPCLLLEYDFSYKMFFALP